MVHGSTNTYNMVTSLLLLVYLLFDLIPKTSDTPVLVPGVWGPYYSAMVANKYLNEGGQSAAGSLVSWVESQCEWLSLWANQLDWVID